jgi:ATP-dependent Clp protease ATP-binding subunit ClpA
MFERFSDPARSAVTASADEAIQRGDRRVGTDHLLLGVLHDPAIADLLGVDVTKARAESNALDQQALKAIGLNVGEFEATFAPRKWRRTQFTSGARSVLPRALSLAVAEKSRRIQTKHLLLALLERERPDPAAVLLTGLKIDRSAVRTKAVDL